jgi:hypothetical protein
MKSPRTPQIESASDVPRGVDGQRRDWGQRLTTGLLALCMLVALSLAFFSLYDRERRSDHAERYLRKMSETQELARALSDAALSAVAGEASAFAVLRRKADALALLHLEMTGEERGGSVDLPEIPRLLETVDTLRDAIRADVERILASRDLILESYELASDLRGALDELAAGSGRLAEQLVETDAPPRLLLQGALQVARAEEMKYALGVSGRLEPEVGAADQGPVAAADAFGAALEQLRSTPSFPDGLRAELARLSALFRRSRDDMEQLVLHRVEMQPAVAAAESTSQGADRLDHAFDDSHAWPALE